MSIYFTKYKTSFILCVFLFLVSSRCYGQQGTAVLNGMYHTQIFTGENKFEKGYGINYQFFVTDDVAIEYNFSYVNVPDNLNYFKLHGGGVLVGYSSSLNLSNYANEVYWVMVFLATLIPEGISYHIDIGDNLTLSPYANLLSFDYADGYLHYNNSLGLRMNMTVLNHLNIAPFAFTQIQYRSKAWGGTRTGFGMGAMLGWRF